MNDQPVLEQEFIYAFYKVWFLAKRRNHFNWSKMKTTAFTKMWGRASRDAKTVRYRWAP